MTRASVIFAVFVLAVGLQAVCLAKDVNHIMDEIKSVVREGISESAESTGMMMNALRNTERGLQDDGGIQKPYPWWALPPNAYEGDLPVWSRAGLNNYLNERIETANADFQEDVANYEQEYCTDYGPVGESEWVPGKFSGGSCKLKIKLGGCYVYPVDGPDKKMPIGFAVNCTTPKIEFEAEKPYFESIHKSGTTYSFRSCRGKSVTLGQEKTNYLQFPGQQFAIPFFSLPARFPPKLSSWIGLPRFFK